MNGEFISGHPYRHVVHEIMPGLLALRSGLAREAAVRKEIVLGSLKIDNKSREGYVRSGSQMVEQTELDCFG